MEPEARTHTRTHEWRHTPVAVAGAVSQPGWFLHSCLHWTHPLYLPLRLIGCWGCWLHSGWTVSFEWSQKLIPPSSLAPERRRGGGGGLKKDWSLVTGARLAAPCSHLTDQLRQKKRKVNKWRDRKWSCVNVNLCVCACTFDLCKEPLVMVLPYKNKPKKLWNNTISETFSVCKRMRVQRCTHGSGSDEHQI